VLAFGACYVAFKHLVWMYFLARRFLYADLAAALGDGHPRAAGARELLEGDCEPPDFFVVGPEAMERVAPAQRGAWFRMLALPLVPFAPGGGDAALAAAGGAIAEAMEGVPDALDAMEPAGEVGRVTGVTAERAAVIGRALVQAARLDKIFGAIAAGTEAGFRAAYGRPPGPLARMTAAERDRLLPRPPRAYLASLAPAWAAANLRP
jgi:hypothetical protein